MISRPTHEVRFSRCTWIQRCPKSLSREGERHTNPQQGVRECTFCSAVTSTTCCRTNSYDIWLTCIPGRLPWTGEWAMVMLRLVRQRRAETSSAWPVFTVPAAVPLVLAPGCAGLPRTVSGTSMWREKCPSTHAGVSPLCRNNPKSSKTAEQANRRWLMLTLKLRTRNPQC